MKCSDRRLRRDRAPGSRLSPLFKKAVYSNVSRRPHAMGSWCRLGFSRARLGGEPSDYGFERCLAFPPSCVDPDMADGVTSRTTNRAVAAGPAGRLACFLSLSGGRRDFVPASLAVYFSGCPGSSGATAMTLTIEAIYENGVLKPAQPLPLKEHEKVRITVEALREPCRADRLV